MLIRVILNICQLVIMYEVYQIVRNEVILNIRKKWKLNNDNRLYKYDYFFMLDPNKHNWYGLKYPKDKHYK